MVMKPRHNGGFTLVEIMIVVAIIGLLAAIAIPNFVKARTLSQQNGCIENLRQINCAKTTWALEQRKDALTVPNDNDLFGATLFIRQKPECPARGTYLLQSAGTKPECSIAGHSL
jgi:prepilin-type N-terminal cleavage/methylation domain-containing protein